MCPQLSNSRGCLTKSNSMGRPRLFVSSWLNAVLLWTPMSCSFAPPSGLQRAPLELTSSHQLWQQPAVHQCRAQHDSDVRPLRAVPAVDDLLQQLKRGPLTSHPAHIHPTYPFQMVPTVAHAHQHAACMYMHLALHDCPSKKRSALVMQQLQGRVSKKGEEKKQVQHRFQASHETLGGGAAT